MPGSMKGLTISQFVEVLTDGGILAEYIFRGEVDQPLFIVSFEDELDL